MYRPVGLPPDDGDLFTGTRVCRRCGERKPMSAFHWSSNRKYRRRVCSACLVAEAAERRAQRSSEAHRRTRFASYLRATYGITIETYNALLEDQGGVCAICRCEFADDARAKAHVDHDHLTGVVRGILCFRCNTAIGKLRDSYTVVARAAEYLLAPPPDVPTIPRSLTPEERSTIARLRRKKGDLQARRAKHSDTVRRFGQRKLSTEQREEIRRRYAVGDETQTRLAAEFGVSQGLISNIVLGKGSEDVA
jgi:hypothetical protein